MMDVVNPTMARPATPAGSSSNVGAPQQAGSLHTASPATTQERVDPAPAEAGASTPGPEELGALVDQANKAFQASASNLRFSVAEGTNISVIRIEDAETGELIRQIPSEEMIAIAQALAEQQQQGSMLQERV